MVFCAFFEHFLAEEAVTVSEAGVEDKAQIVASMAESDCEVRSYALDDMQVVLLNENTGRLTYKASKRVSEGRLQAGRYRCLERRPAACLYWRDLPAWPPR